MGGEHGAAAAPPAPSSGSPPRGRGTPRPHPCGGAESGLTPAWAGNTRRCTTRRRRRRAHPRVGGEHAPAHRGHDGSPGSPPRGRGTLAATGLNLCGRGLTPAWAGNTSCNTTARRTGRAHPRVGGEHSTPWPYAADRWGSPPRGRGTLDVRLDEGQQAGLTPAWAGNTCHAVCRLAMEQGSPPRGRGTHPRDAVLRRPPGLTPAWAGNTEEGPVDAELVGLTPAWAGNTRTVRPDRICPRAHPRVGGEHVAGGVGDIAKSGSPPRGRGTHDLAVHYRDNSGLTPAWAGNTERPQTSERRWWAHPRVGGEHERQLADAGDDPGSPPRGRGTLRRRPRRSSERGLTPAWAGNTRTAASSRTCSSAHPRVGGEHRRSVR